VKEGSVGRKEMKKGGNRCPQDPMWGGGGKNGKGWRKEGRKVVKEGRREGNVAHKTQLALHKKGKERSIFFLPAT
jgi:hypothetical protein